MSTALRNDVYKRRVIITLGALIIVATFSALAVIRSHIALAHNAFFRAPPPLFSLYAADFMCFYAAAQVAAQGLSAVYDPALLDTAQAAITEPVQATNPHYNYVYPPFLTPFLTLFSDLSFGKAYYTWMAVSYLMTTCGVFLLTPIGFKRWQKILCGALLPLGFPFFSFTVLTSGQLSSLGLLIFAVVIRLRKVSHRWAGVALALGLYKPPLFVGYVVLALMAREWRLLQGAIIGAIALVGISIACTGTAPWLAFLSEASGYVYGRSLSDGRSLPPGKGMGLLSAAIGLTGGTTIGWSLFLIISVGAMLIHTRVYQREIGDRDFGERFEQASRITLTYLLSIQAINYDAALLIIPIMLVGGAYGMRAPTLHDLYFFTSSLLLLVVAGTMDTENGNGISTGCVSVMLFWFVLLHLWKHGRSSANPLAT
jgi:hypothetical protein